MILCLLRKVLSPFPFMAMLGQKPGAAAAAAAHKRLKMTSAFDQVLSPLVRVAWKGWPSHMNSRVHNSCKPHKFSCCVSGRLDT